MPKIKFSGGFNNDYEDLKQDLPGIEIIVDRRVIWFKNNSNDTRLRNHALTKGMEGKWAFSITDDIRIVYKWTSKTTVRFLAIGPHEKVYPKKPSKMQK